MGTLVLTLLHSPLAKTEELPPSVARAGWQGIKVASPTSLHHLSPTYERMIRLGIFILRKIILLASQRKWCIYNFLGMARWKLDLAHCPDTGFSVYIITNSQMCQVAGLLTSPSFASSISSQRVGLFMGTWSCEQWCDKKTCNSFFFPFFLYCLFVPYGTLSQWALLTYQTMSIMENAG